MYQFGGNDSKRKFRVVMGGKEHGLYVSSTPFSAAKKAVTKLCLSNKKKVEFYLHEITNGSKKKIYGPYLGNIEKIKNSIKYKTIVKLNKKKNEMKGGLFDKNKESKIKENAIKESNKESNNSIAGIKKMFKNFKINNPSESFHYKTRFSGKNTLYFGKEHLEINSEKYYSYSLIINTKTESESPFFRILIKEDNNLESDFSDFTTPYIGSGTNPGRCFKKIFISEHLNYSILVIKDLKSCVEFIKSIWDDENNIVFWRNNSKQQSSNKKPSDNYDLTLYLYNKNIKYDNYLKAFKKFKYNYNYYIIIKKMIDNLSEIESHFFDLKKINRPFYDIIIEQKHSLNLLNINEKFISESLELFKNYTKDIYNHYFKIIEGEQKQKIEEQKRKIEEQKEENNRLEKLIEENITPLFKNINNVPAIVRKLDKKDKINLINILQDYRLNYGKVPLNNNGEVPLNNTKKELNFGQVSFNNKIKKEMINLMYKKVILPKIQNKTYAEGKQV